MKLFNSLFSNVFMVALTCALLLNPNITAAEDITATEDRMISLTGIAGSGHQELASDILRRAYESLGYTVEITDLPANRSIEMVNAGEFDGETHRIARAGDKFPNLVKVPVALHKSVWRPFTLLPDVTVSTWSELSDYRVGAIVGALYVDELPSELNLELASPQNLGRMLEAGRLDVVVVSQSTATNFDVNVRAMGDLTLELDLFHYVHSSQSDLIPDLSTTLQGMKDAGAYGADLD